MNYVLVDAVIQEIRDISSYSEKTTENYYRQDRTHLKITNTESKYPIFNRKHHTYY